MKTSKTTKNKRNANKRSTNQNSFLKRVRKLSARQWVGIGVLTILICLALGYGIVQSQKSLASSGKLHVVASFYPVFELARQIGGDAANVESIIPAGAEAHDFEPSPQTLTKAHHASLFIYHDKKMEPWATRFIKDYSGVVVESIAGIKTHSVDNNHSHEEEVEHDHDHIYDPHVWTDPVLASAMVDNILAGFVAADPANRTIYESNATKFKSELSQLDQDFSQQLSTCKQRTIVTSHAAYRYLADRYNLAILPISGLSPTQEPSAGKLAELSDLVNKRGISTIFFESQTNTHLAQTLARETGAKTAILDPIEGINQASSKETYVSIQQKNLVSLKTALACN